MKLSVLALVLGVSAFVQFSVSGAETITYVFDGTASGTLGSHSYTNADLTVTAVENTTDVPAPIGADNIIDVDPSLVTIKISGLAPTTISNGYIFDNQALQSGGFGATSGSDTIQIPDPSFGSWNMKTAFGPVFAASDRSIADWTDMPTSQGALAVNSYTNFTFTATLGSGSVGGNMVPLPSAEWLSLIGLAFVAIVARRGLHAPCKA
jgi:hypothetical protein